MQKAGELEKERYVRLLNAHQVIWTLSARLWRGKRAVKKPDYICALRKKTGSQGGEITGP